MKALLYALGYIGFIAGLAVIASVRSEPEHTPCKAQVVEWVRDGGRCSFIPVASVLNGTLENGVCITAEVGQ